MSDNNDKTQTFEFHPVKDEKPQKNRSENDEYSAARRNKSYEKEEASRSSALIYVAVILAVILIAAVIAGIFILRPANEPQQNLPENDNVAVLPNEKEEEEEPTEEKNITVSCSMVFYSDSVIKKDNGYTVLADLYDKDFYKFDNRKLIINDDTDIREDGKRLSADALIYLIESMAGEGFVFDGEIREDDSVVLSIDFDGSFREEMENPEEEKNPPEGEDTPPEGDVPAEGEGEQTPAEEIHIGNTTTEN